MTGAGLKEAFNAAFERNVLTAVNIGHAAFDHLRPKDETTGRVGGSYTFTGSGLADVVDPFLSPMSGPYMAAKAALVGLVNSLAHSPLHTSQKA